MLHGLNEVFKVPPYEPSASGFGDDDAAFLQANGFNAMRVGVIWAAVEPQPGVYDDAYLASIAQTVQTLGAHGIVSLLDFHQDLYNEKFQGEGAPAWAVQDGGPAQPRPRLPVELLRQPRRGPRVGRVLAQREGVRRRRAAGPLCEGVGARGVGTSAATRRLRLRADERAVARHAVAAVRGADGRMPAVRRDADEVLHAGDAMRSGRSIRRRRSGSNRTCSSPTSTRTHLGTINDAHMGWAFHDYCGTASIGLGSTGCAALDELTVESAKVVSDTAPPALAAHGVRRNQRSGATCPR